MKSGRILYLVIGFFAGVIYLVACSGSGNSVAAAIINAIDIVYDNATSGLTAINVQTAIDEVVDRLKSLEGCNSDQLVGTWNGTDYDDNGNEKSFNITFNDDGSYTCTCTSSCVQECATSGTWEIKANDLMLLMVPVNDKIGYFPVLVKSTSDSSLTLVWRQMAHVAMLAKSL